MDKIIEDSEFSDIEKEAYITNKKIAKLILSNKVLENRKIISNEDKMNFLIILILYEKLNEIEESNNFNRSLRTDENNYQKVINYIIKNNIGQIDKINNKNKIENINENNKKRKFIYI